uniref:Uncharacterized protein n=1 Tax=Kalanchoe fedtschenkoi TaxID=63787 RepID=A0A7N0T9G3_KALFE
MMRVFLLRQKTLLLFLLLCIAGLWLGDGSSRVHVHQVAFNPMRPHYHHHNSPADFMGFLPRGIPIPNSAPSRKHNSIGLQSWRPSRASSSSSSSSVTYSSSRASSSSQALLGGEP